MKLELKNGYTLFQTGNCGHTYHVTEMSGSRAELFFPCKSQRVERNWRTSFFKDK